MTQFIRLGDNLLLNLDHVVSIDYRPAKSGFDEDTQRSYSYPARLRFVTLALELEQACNYAGETIASASSSITYEATGEHAAQMWAKLNHDAKE